MLNRNEKKGPVSEDEAAMLETTHVHKVCSSACVLGAICPVEFKQRMLVFLGIPRNMIIVAVNDILPYFFISLDMQKRYLVPQTLKLCQGFVRISLETELVEKFFVIIYAIIYLM